MVWNTSKKLTWQLASSNDLRTKWNVCLGLVDERRRVNSPSAITFSHHLQIWIWLYHKNNCFFFGDFQFSIFFCLFLQRNLENHIQSFQAYFLTLRHLIENWSEHNQSGMRRQNGPEYGTDVTWRELFSARKCVKNALVVRTLELTSLFMWRTLRGRGKN